MGAVPTRIIRGAGGSGGPVTGVEGVAVPPECAVGAGVDVVAVGVCGASSTQSGPGADEVIARNVVCI